MKANNFNQNVPEIKKLLEDYNVREYIEKTLVSVLNSLGVEEANEVVEGIVGLAQNYENRELGYERSAHEFLRQKGITREKIAERLSGRADLIFEQIQAHLKEGSVLDFGCGDGKVGERISQEGLEVVLSDIYKHSHIDETKLSFIDLKNEEISEKYDNTLLLTVLHHSYAPVETLENAINYTKNGGRVIVIESVYGINDGSEFGKLDQEQQRMTNIFFDHFYNRIIHYSEDSENKVPVPFNFRMAEGESESWEQIFKELGLKEVATEYLGIDQLTVPEYHTLHVLEVQNDS